LATQVDCYLSFDGNCEEALNFYAQGRRPGSARPLQKQGHARDGEAEGAQIMGSDVPPGIASGGKCAGSSVSVRVKEDVARRARCSTRWPPAAR
jgi:uncharacterized glyoxalase superfamily protein PhnB